MPNIFPQMSAIDISNARREPPATYPDASVDVDDLRFALI